MNDMFVIWLLSCSICLKLAITEAHRITIEETVTRHGYPVESHKVTTSDGYILTVLRIPNPDRRPALLVHGMLYSSAEWCIYGKQSLAMRIFDARFDVWLPNCRGNTFSRKHTRLNVASEKFWDFSWHEIGVRDLPALIDYVLRVTGFTKLHYIGHSQGTTSFFVLNSIMPQYGDKIETAHLLAPTCFMTHTYSPPSRALIPRMNEIRLMAQMTGSWEIFAHDDDSSFIGATKAALTDALPPDLFLIVMYCFGGMRSLQHNHSIIRKIMETVPAGTSLKLFVHYGQVMQSGKFQQYDYGPAGNLERYNATTSPEYKVEHIRAPVALYYSDNDWYVDPKDVELLKTKLTNVIFDYHITLPEFNHLDFLFDNAAVKIYNEIIRIMTMSSESEH